MFLVLSWDDWLLSIAKLQNLKAIHNAGQSIKPGVIVVINHETTKFESNSQPTHVLLIPSISCYQSQNYKIWKQFTTDWWDIVASLTLLSITKLQNLKAIHNYLADKALSGIVVINLKTTKFESNSQHGTRVLQGEVCCYQSQKYKT